MAECTYAVVRGRTHVAKERNCWACSILPPFLRKAVMPVARNVRSPTVSSRPTVWTRRLVIWTEGRPPAGQPRRPGRGAVRVICAFQLGSESSRSRFSSFGGQAFEQIVKRPSLNG
jgi:hypothetical protein